MGLRQPIRFSYRKRRHCKWYWQPVPSELLTVGPGSLDEVDGGGALERSPGRLDCVTKKCARSFPLKLLMCACSSDALDLVRPQLHSYTACEGAPSICRALAS